MSQRKVELYEEAIALQKSEKVEFELPHLFAFKPYKWTREYWDSTNRMKFICSGNQASKSSTQIRHAIDLATDPSKWPEFFPLRSPHTFWYVYPDGNKINEEFKDKWEREFMPRGSMMDHERYGWKKLHYKNNFVGVQFNTGVSIYFKSWRQDFQSSTIDAAFVDEEIPFNLYDEIAQRLNHARGIFSMVFTATLGQKEWFDVIELRGKKNEKFPDAFKVQVSLEHDCRYYADGSPSPFTPQEVDRRKALCSSEREINRRIHGRFVSDEGLVVPSFNKTRNVRVREPLNKQWYFYGGVDIGTGGRDNHPAAISIIAVKPDFTFGKLVRFWKGNTVETTTTTDILNKYIDMSKDLSMTGAFYDWSSKEFHLRAQAAGIPFQKADKARDFGYDLMNTLFKNQMFYLEEAEHTDELVYELENLKTGHRKQDATDDGCFVGETLVETELGAIPISEIRCGQRVFTRLGLKEVVATSRHVAETHKFILPCGAEIVCTENHKFYVEEEFREISLINKTEKLLRYQEWQDQKASFLTESPLEDIRTQNTSPTVGTISRAGLRFQRACRGFIKRFGSTIMDRFPGRTIYITRTATPLTTRYQTLSAFPRESTALNTQENTTKKIQTRLRPTLKRFGHSLRLGTARLREKSFIRKTGILFGKIKRSSTFFVLSVERALRVTLLRPTISAQTPVNLNIDGFLVSTTWKRYVTPAKKASRQANIQSPKTVQRNAGTRLGRKKTGRRWVYNITVEDAHEYFAGGYLVANCDALRYSQSSVPWDFSGVTTNIVIERRANPDDLPKKRNSRHLNPLSARKDDEWNYENDIDDYNDLLGGF